MLNSIVAFQHSKKESSPQKKDFQSEQPFSFSAFSFSPQKEYKEKKGGERGGLGPYKHMYKEEERNLRGNMCPIHV